MIKVNIQMAKRLLSELLERVKKGEEVIITKRNKPIAKLTPMESPKPERRIGTAKGKVKIADDFDVSVEDFPIGN